MAAPWSKGKKASAPIGRKKPDNKLRELHLDGQVILKIIKHCHEELPTEVTGSLLGLDVGPTLEVTNCFPYLDDDVDSNYQGDMMKCLREVNVDNNCVGWYQSSFLGSFCTPELVLTQFEHQNDLGPKMVVIIYDPVQTMRGNLSMKAFRLTDEFMEVCRKAPKATREKEVEMVITKRSLSRAGLDSSNILEEIPIRIHNASLIKALLYELKEEKATGVDCNFDRLDLSINPFLEKNLEALCECIQDLAQEQIKFHRHDREVGRKKAQYSNWLQERRVENSKRIEMGKEPLPEEDTTGQFKPELEPSRLNSLLVSKQVSTYCKQVNRFSGKSFSKLFLAGSFHKK